jgi:tripartite-type tricarboxylate transporter receptor subunit TctC
MLRGIFTTKNATPEQIAFYVDLFKKVMETPDWQEFMEKGAFNQTSMTGPEFEKWLTEAEARHRELMQSAGFIAGQ